MGIEAPIRSAEHGKSPDALRVKAQVHQIVWHSADLKGTPVFSVSLCPIQIGGKYILASGGGDRRVMLWAVSLVEDMEQDAKTQVTHLETLAHHTNSVNCVRFSPDGYTLASGSDGGEVILWKPQNDDELSGWRPMATLRGHKSGGDVFDLCWSPDGNELLSGSVDSHVIVWDVSKGKPRQHIEDHHAFVQGVAWDPQNQFVVFFKCKLQSFATQSSDRSCKIYSKRKRRAKKQDSEYSCVQTIQKATLDNDSNNSSMKNGLFLDDTLSSFFRRLSFTPDGKFLVIPAGVIKRGSNDADIPTTWIYKTTNLKRPFASLPSHKGSTVSCVSSDGKMLATASVDGSIFIYSATRLRSIAAIGGLHLAPITDLSFSHDSSLLAASSQDGYVSFVLLQS